MPKTKTDQTPILRYSEYPALSDAEVLKDGSTFFAQIKYGPHPFLDGLYSGVCNYNTDWSWTIKETYHELVMNGQIVCTDDK